MRHILSLALIATALVARAAHAQGTIVGTVTDDAGRRPLVGADLRLARSTLAARTDSAGRFRLVGVPHGTWTLTARRLGFASISVTVQLTGDSAVADFRLHEIPEQLAEVKVQGVSIPLRLAEFETRRRLKNGGYYIGGDDLLKNADRQLADLIREKVPMAQVQRAPDGSAYLTNRRSATATRPGFGEPPGMHGSTPQLLISLKNVPCVPRVFLNGVAYPDSTISAFSPGDLAGVEFHDVTTTPVQYRLSGTECGVLLLWSR